MQPETLGHFVQAGQAAQLAVDRAIARADLLANLRRCHVEIKRLKHKHLTELTDAEIRRGFAELALEDFDHEGRAP